MFAELFPIIKEAKSVLLRLHIDQQDPTKLQVFVTPQHPNGAKHPALNQTIMLSNTPELLDQDFAVQYQAYAPHYVAASSSITDSLAQLAASAEAAKKPASKPGTKADSSKANATTPKAAPKPAVPPQVSLFADIDNTTGNNETDSDGDSVDDANEVDPAATIAPLGISGGQPDLLPAQASHQVQQTQSSLLGEQLAPVPLESAATAPAALFHQI